MTTSNYGVHPLFSEPYFKASIGHAITEKQISFLKNLKMIKNQTNQISENLYIFEEPELKSIKDAVQEALDIYAREVMGIPQKLYVTQSWSLINPPEVGMHGHSHSNSVVSGSLYYCDMPEPVSGMIFDKHSAYQQLQLTPGGGKVNIYNTTKNRIQPKKNDLILFSSSLVHYVETNLSNQPRYSLAFNTFIKGKLGDYRDVSELIL